MKPILSKAFAVTASVAFTATLLSPLALAPHSLGIFEMDGDPTNGAASGDDWSSLFPVDTSANEVDKVFMSEPQETDVTYFTGGGSKDELDIPRWGWNTLHAPDKDEITNAYAAGYVSGPNSYVVLGMDRYAQNGNSAAGFWLLQDAVGLLYESPTTGNFTGNHTLNDLLIVSDFDKGGSVSTIRLYRWDPSVDDNLALVATGAECGAVPTDQICARVNKVNVASPWPYVPKAGASGTIPKGGFLEAIVNITSVFPDRPCFRSFVAETRSSTSTDSTLHDFALASVGTCIILPPDSELVVDKTPLDASVDVGDSFGFSITLTNLGPDPSQFTNLTDELPDVAGAWTLSGPDAADCALTGDSLSCVFGTVDDGDSRSVTVTASTTDFDDCGDQVNLANATGNLGRAWSEDTATVHVTCADVGIEKTADQSTIALDGTITFTLTVTSHGPDDATNVTLSDELPPASGGWTLGGPDAADCTLSGTTLACAFGVLAPGDTRTVTATGRTGEAIDCGNVDNTASVHADVDSNASNNEDSASAHVTCADVSIVKSAGAPEVDAGGTVSFTITVTSNGPDDAEDVQVSDTLPALSGAWTLSGPDAGDCAIVAGVLSCDFGTLPVGESRSVTVSAETTLEDCGGWENAARVSATVDTEAANDLATAFVHVACADVAVSKSASEDTVDLGGEVEFTITVSSLGPDAAENVTLADELPAGGAGWTLGGPDAASCAIVGTTLACDFGTIPAGETRTITVSQETGILDCGALDNRARVSAALDVDPSNDEDSASVHVRCSDVAVEKSGSGADLGGSISFTLTVSSLGPDAATNVVLSDALPSVSGSWSLSGPDASSCTLAGLALSCSFGTLAPGDSRTVTVTATTTATSDCGDVENTATVRADIDSNAANSVASAIAHVTCADVGVAKEPLDPDVDLGGSIGFAITVTSYGPDAAEDVLLTDTLPAISGSWTLGGADAAACSISGSTLSCGFGTLAPGSGAFVTVTGTTGEPSDCGDRANVASVRARVDVSPGNNLAEATVHVRCADVRVEKSPLSERADVGSPFGYSIVVTSEGPDAAEDVTLLDPLPSFGSGWTIGGPDAIDCELVALSLVSCEFGTMAPGETRAITLTAQSSLRDCGDVGNVATVGARLDIHPADDSDGATVHVTCADVSVEKSASETTVDVNATLTFTIVVTSNGPDAAEGVSLTDALPDVSGGWTLGGPDAASCALAGASLSCDFGTIPAGETRTVTITGATSLDASGDCGDADNVATVGARVDTAPENNADGATVHVTCADVGVLKTALDPTIDLGHEIGFSIVVSSNGPDAAHLVSFFDVFVDLGEPWTIGGADAASCTLTGLSLACDFGTIPAGETRSITATAATGDLEDCGDWTNTGRVGAAVDTNPLNDASSATVHVTCADVSVLKTADSSTIDIGQTLGFTITVTSNGPDAAESVTLSDSLPDVAGPWTLGGPDAIDCEIVGLSLACDFGTLAPGATRTLTIQAPTSYAASDCGDVPNVAAVAARLDTNAANDASSATAHVTCADVSVEKSATESVDVEATVTFTIVVTSNGPDAAESVTLSDPLPAVSGGWTLGGPDAASCAIVSDVLSCDFGTLAPGETRTVTVTGATSIEALDLDCGDHANAATVRARVDTDATNDVDEALAHVTCADVAIEKRALDGVIDAGDAMGFAIVVTSLGPDAAENVTLADSLPAVTGAWSLGGPDAGACALAGLLLSCDFGTLGAGESRAIDLTAATSLADCGDWTNEATVRARIDTNPANDASRATVHVTCADVSVEKTASNATIDVGQDVGFSITVTSNGPDAADAVTLTDALPPVPGGWTLGGPDAIDCEIVTLTLSCAFGTMPAGAQKSVTLTAPTTLEDCGDVANEARVGARFDTNGANDSDGASAHVTCADVAITKEPIDPDVDAGETARFAITLTSLGPDAAESASFFDVFPELDWTLSGPDAGACSIVLGVLACDFGTIPAGEARTVIASAETTSEDCGPIDNRATARARLDTNATNNEDDASIHVRCADVGVEKRALPGFVDVLENVTFEIVVTSFGPDAAENVTLADALPSLAGAWSLGGPDAASCAILGGMLTCDFGTIPAGGTRTVTVTAATSLADCGRVPNEAMVSARLDTFRGNDASFASAHVVCADVEVAKSALDATIDFGGTVAFAITVTALGPDASENVTLADLLPDVGSGWSLSGPDAIDCELVALTLSCSFGTIPAGESRSVTASTGTSSTDCGEWLNLASARSRLDTNATNDADDARAYVRCADVGVEKRADASPISAGDVASFTIMVSSNGPDAAESVTLVDALPAVSGAWSLSGPDAIDCAIVGSLLACEFGTMSPGETRTVTVSAPTSAEDCGLVPNEASVRARLDTDASNDADGAFVEVLCPLLVVEKIAGELSVIVGGNASFTIVVTNAGSGNAYNVTLTDPLPATANGWTDDSPDCAVAAGVLTCDYGTMAPGDTRSVTVTTTTTPDDCGFLDNLATATPSNGPPASDRASIHVRCADVGVQKLADAPAIDGGDPLGFTILVSSFGPDAADAVALADLLPTVSSGWALGGPDAIDCSMIGLLLTCSFGTLAPGDTRTIRVTATTSPVLADGDCGAIENTATVSAVGDVNPANDEASASTHVRCRDVSVVKTVSPASILPHETATFTITVTSNGPEAADDVTLVDTLPALSGGWILGGPDAIDCEIVALTLACSFGTLAPGETRSITVTLASSERTDCGTHDNTARVAATRDGNASNDASTATLLVDCTIPPESTITVEKVAADPVIDFGEVAEFGILVSNSGPDPAENVTLFDILPFVAGGWTLSGPDAIDCSILFGVLACDFGTIEVLGERSITLTAGTTIEDCGDLDNLAVVSANDGNNNDASFARIHVTCADVSVEKTALVSPISASDTAGFTIVVTSNGPDAAENVTLVDALPATLLGWTLSGPDSPACAIAGLLLSCDFGTLPAGGSRVVRVESLTVADDCGPLANLARVTARLDSDPANDASFASIDVLCPFLVVEKVADAPFVSAGDAIGFTITVTNLGPGTAYTVSLFDPLPASAGAWFLDGPDAGDCAVAGLLLTCAFGPLAAGASASVHAFSVTSEAECGPVPNTARVFGLHPFGGEATAVVAVLCPDVVVSKIADASEVSAGDLIGFTLTVTNLGPGTAYGVSLADALPSVGVWILAGPDAIDCSIVSDFLSCAFGTLLPTESRSVHVSTETSHVDCGAVENFATAWARNDDERELAFAAVLVRCPDIVISKVADSPVANAGDPIGFTLTVTNLGPGTAYGVTLVDALPAVAGGWTLAGPDAIDCAIVGLLLSCAFGTLAPGESRSIRVEAVASPEDCGLLANLAFARAENGRLGASDAASIDVRCAEVRITKIADAPIVNAGDPIGFTIVVTNAGAGDAYDVNVTDFLPAVSGAWSLDGPDAGDCALLLGALSCAFGTLEAGGLRAVHVSATTGPEDCGFVDNAATVTTSNDGSAVARDGVLVLCPELALEKAGGAVDAGGVLTFAITVTNLGPGFAYGLTLSDLLPATSGTWSASTPECVVIGPALSCAIGDLPPGGSFTAFVHAETSAEDCGSVPNEASASSTNGGRAFASGAGYVRCADVSVEKTADEEEIEAGGTLSFTIVVTSNGPDAAENVTLADALPTPLFAAWSLTGPDAGDCSIVLGLLACDFGTLAAGDTRSVTVSRAALVLLFEAECGDVDNLASVTARLDLDASNDADGASVHVRCSNVSIAKSADPPNVDAGDALSFLLVVSSHGPDAAENVTLFDPLPSLAGAWTLSGPDAGDCAISLGTLTCDFGTVPAGDTRTVTVTIETTRFDCGPVFNVAVASADFDLVPFDNLGFADASVRCADLSVEKTAGDAEVDAGSTLSFTLTVASNGPDAAENVTLVDALPGSGWLLSGPDALDCAIALGILSCDFGTLPAGDTRSVTLSREATSEDCGGVENAATVAARLDVDPSNDSDDAFVAVRCGDASVAKTATAPIGPSGTFGFTITVASDGPGPAEDVELADALPAVAGGWTLGGPDAGDCSLAGLLLTCEFGTLAAGETRTITLTATATVESCGAYPNEAFVTATVDVDPSDNADAAIAFVRCADVGVEKRAWYASVNRSEDVVFDVIVTSNGPDAAENVTLTDLLPALSGGWEIAGPDAGACSVTLSLLTCDFGTIPAGETRSITLIGHTQVVGCPECLCDCGYINNLAFVTADVDTNAGNNFAWASTFVDCSKIPPESAPFVEKVAVTPAVPLGSDVVFNVTVTNPGPASATLVNLTDVLPPISGGWTLSGPDAGACTLVGLGLACFFGTLLPGESRTITLTGATGEPSDCGFVDNTAFLLANRGASRDFSAAHAFVLCSDVSVEKTGAGTVDSGSAAWFTITVTSDGPGPADNVTLADPLPDVGAGWTLSGPDAIDCEIVALQLSCSFGTLLPGETRTVTVSSETGEVDDCGDWPNLATVAAAIDIDERDNADAASVHVTCADVSVEKTALFAVVDVGGTMGFAITVTSNGPEAAENVSLFDALPFVAGGWTLGGPDAIDCAIVLGFLSCSFGTLAPGDTRSIQVTAESTIEECGPVENRATVAARLDIDASNDVSASRLYVWCADVSVEKVADDEDVDFGGTVSFTILVTSNGPDAAENVTLSDALPSLSGAWTLSGPDAIDCAIVADVLSCSFGTMAPGETRSVTVSAESSLDDCGYVWNAADVEARVDTNPQNDHASAFAYVRCADVGVEKLAESASVDVGGVIVYTIVVTAYGPDPSENVTLTDLFPPISLGGYVIGDVGGCGAIGYLLTCDFGTMLPGETRTLTVVLSTSLADCGDWSNTASVTARLDSNATNNESTALVHVACADVGVEKTPDEATIDVGGTVSFTIAVTSNGPDAAENVTLADALPPVSGGWSLSGLDAIDCSITGLLLACDFGDLAAGATRTVVVSAETTLEDCGPWRNVAIVSARLDTNPQNNEDAGATYVRCADVGVEKTALDLDVDVLGAIGFAITVTSNGPDAAENVTLSDALPAVAGAWVLGGPDAAACTLAGLLLTCDFGTIPAGDTRSILLTAETTLDDCGRIENLAAVRARLDTNARNDADGASLYVRCADVTVEKRALDEDVDAGGAIGFTIVVTSNGPDAAENVTLADVLPPATWAWTLSGPDAADCLLLGLLLLCDFGTIPAGETRTVIVTSEATTVAECGWILNAADVRARLDTNLRDNHDLAALYVRCADVSVEKTARDADVPAGGAIAFTIVVSSNGPDAAENVTLADLLPAVSGGWTLSGPDAVDCAIAGPLLACDFGTMAPGETRAITLTALTTLEDCGDVRNLAQVFARLDTNPQNDRDDATIHVACADVGVEKRADAPQIDKGEAAGFTIVVTSYGPDDAQNVTLFDLLPTVSGGWTVEGPDAGDCAILGASLYCDFGTIPAGETRTIHITGQTTDLPDCDCGNLNNIAIVSALVDLNPANNLAFATVHVRCADLEVEKYADDADVDAGDLVGFTITVTANGPDPSENSTLTDLLAPASGGWTLSGPDASDCTITGLLLACDFGTIPVGESRTVHVAAPMGATPEECGEIVNTVRVRGDADLDPRNDGASATVHVRCGGVSVEKTPDEGEVDVLGAITFTIVLTSVGPGPAFNASLVDALPAGSWTLGGPDAIDCTIALGVLSCSFGTLAEGETRTITLTRDSTLEDCGWIRNEAFASASIDLDPSDNADAAAIYVRCADVGVEKTPDALTEDVGFPLSFSITVTSNGPDAAENVTLTDTLPAASGAWTLGGPDAIDCAIVGLLLACDFGILAPGDTRTVTVSAETTIEDCGAWENLAFVSARLDTDASNDADLGTRYVRCADVGVEKTADDEDFDVGGVASFTITVTSLGPDAAENVTLFDFLPPVAGAWSLSGPDAVDCAIFLGLLACDFGTIPAGDSRSVTVSAETTLEDCGWMENFARVRARLDTNPQNDADGAALYVRCADVGVEKSAADEDVDVGGLASFTITVTSFGPDAAENVTLTDFLPFVLGGWLLAGPDAIDCAILFGFLACDFGTVPAGGTRTITLSAETTIEDCGGIRNAATVWARLDTFPQNDASVAFLYVRCADVSVEKTADAAVVDKGEDVGFTIVVSSNGPDAAENVTLVDLLPALSGGWTVEGPDAAACAIVGFTLACDFGTIPAGDTRTIHVTGSTAPPVVKPCEEGDALCDCGNINNFVFVSARADTDASNDFAWATTLVLCADVGVAKSPILPVVLPHESFGFTIVVTSNGPDAAENVTLTDTLPSLSGPWILGGPDAIDCAIVGLALACDFGTMPAGDTRTITVHVEETLRTDCGTHWNTARVAARLDVDGSNNASTARGLIDCTIPPESTITLEKVAHDPFVDLGGTIGFDLLVSNSGPDAAENVTLWDDLPPVAGGWTLSGPDAGDCALVGLNLTCAFGTIEVFGTRTVTLTAETGELDDCGAKPNVAYVTANDGNNNDRDAATTYVRCADVSVEKTAHSDVADVGTTIGFAITVTSNGPDAAENVTLTDLLPPASSGWNLTGPDAGACALAGPLLTCDFGTLPAGATRTIHVTALPGPADCGPIENRAVVTARLDVDPRGNSDGARTYVVCSDVSVAKAPLDADVDVGGVVGFTIVVTSLGPDAAAGVTLTDALPPLSSGWALSGPDAGACAIVANVLTCAFGTIPVGDSRSVTVSGASTLDDCGWVRNAATVAAPTDIESGNDRASAELYVRCADVGVEKLAESASVDVGGVIVYTIVVTAYGPDPSENVTLTDLFPPISLGGYVTGDVGGCSAFGYFLTCEFGTMLPGETRTLTVVLSTSLADCGDWSNTASVTARLDSNATNNESTALVHVACADVGVEKTPDEATIDVGGTVSFTIAVTSNGPDAAENVTLADALPPVSGGWSLSGLDAIDCSITGLLLACDFGDLAAGATRTIVVSAETTLEDCGPWRNLAIVSARLDTNPQNNEDAGSTYVRCADVSVEKTALDLDVDVLGAIGFAITVTSNGPDAAENVTLSDALPAVAGAWVLGGPDAAACTLAGLLLTCDFGTIPAGDTRSILLTAETTLDDCGRIENLAAVRARLDTNAQNNEDGASLYVRCADVGVEKTASAASVDVGDVASFVVTVTSYGPDAAENVTLTDFLPLVAGGWSLSGPDAGACAILLSLLSCDIGTIPAGDTRAIRLTAETTLEDCGRIENAASVRARLDTFEPNNASIASLWVACADVSVEKTAADAEIDNGDTASFTITVTSNGPDAAENVTLVDALPALAGGWTLSGPDAAACAIVLGVLACDFGTIPAGGSRSVTVSGATGPEDCADLDNLASVRARLDTDGANDRASASIHVRCGDVGVLKSAHAPWVAPGGTIGFTLVVTSHGPGPAFHVTLADALPAGAWTLGGPDAGDCTLVGLALSCAFGTMPAGDTRTITLTRKATLADCSRTIENVAIVSADVDLEPGNNADGASVRVVCSDVGVRKTAVNATVPLGANVEFTIVVTSNGPDAAENVTLTDLLPPMIGGWTVAGPDAGACSINVPLMQLTCAFGTMAPGDTRTILLVGATTDPACDCVSDKCSCGNVNNFAYVAASVDLNPANNFAWATVLVECPVVPPQSTITVEKTADSGEVPLGSPVSFTITVTNSGPDPAEDANLSDVLPPISGGWTLSGPDAGDCTLTGLALACSFGTIEVLGTRTIVVTGATGEPADCGRIDNTAFVTANDGEANDASSASARVLCADVGVLKTIVSEIVDLNDTIEYTIVVTSYGPDAATGVTLSDALPTIASGWTLGGPDAGDCALVNDTLSCAFGTMAPGETRTITLTGHAASLPCGELTNTARVAADVDTNATNDASTAAIFVDCLCPHTQGFWKNHEEAWPVDSLTLGNWTYNVTELLTLFATSPSGDASLILAHQLIAAKLNVAKGADGTPIAGTIAAADALLAGYSGPLPYGVAPSSPAGAAMVALAATLDEYNNGLLTSECLDWP